MAQADGEFLRHTSCPYCGGSDPVAAYLNEKDGEEYVDGFCFSCEKYVPPDEIDLEAGEKMNNFNPSEFEQYEHRGWKSRIIGKPVSEFYQIRTELDESGDALKRFYPVTEQGSLVGYKVRDCKNKDFSVVGKAKNTCDMFGQSLFAAGGKFLVICGGEEDAASLQQAMWKKNPKYTTAIVSPINGEGSTAKQIKANYEWVTSFEKIVLMLDNDEAGKKATEEALKVLKPGQGYVAKLNLKDPNEYIQAHREEELVSVFWKAERYSPAGIVGSSQTWDALVTRAKSEKVSMPNFAVELSRMLNGGPALGEITTLAAACVDAETEYLTKHGWQRVADFSGNEEIAVVDDSLTLTFEKPINYIATPCDEMLHFKTKYGVDQVVSKNHRIPHMSCGGNFTVKTAQEVYDNHSQNVNGFRGNFIQVFKTQGGQGIDYSEGELRLQIAVMADGRIVKEGKDNYTQMRFRKKRKYDRLLEMCNKFGLRYSDRGWYESEKTYQVIVWPKTNCKHFDDSWYEATNEQLEIIADEIMFWDGTQIHNNIYFSDIKSDVDFVQYVFSSQGRRCRILKGTNVWEAHVKGKVGESKRNIGMGMSRGASGKPEVKTVHPIDGMQYCFETTTGFWLARRNGNVFMTGNSSIGKTSVVNEFLYHWAFNSPYKVGVISLETDVGELTENLLSLHIDKKLASLPDDERLDFYNSDEAKEAHKNLTTMDDGTDRFIILDHQGDVIDSELKEKQEYLVRGLDCKLIILDPITLALSGKNNEGMDEYMAWLLRFVKANMISQINVAHVRKSSSGGKANSTGADIHEEDIKGSGSAFQVSANNILLMRDKENEDDTVRNTTKVVLSKSRRTGNTGPAGWWFYNHKTSRLEVGEDPHGDYKKEEILFNGHGAFNDTNPDDMISDIKTEKF